MLCVFISYVAATLPKAPVDLRADFLPSPALGVRSLSPTLSFIIPSSTSTNASAAAIRFVVRRGGARLGEVVWDSGELPPTPSSEGPPCSARTPALTPASSYSFTASWKDDGSGRWSELSLPSSFDTDIVDWSGAEWVGAGHGQLKFELVLPATTALSTAGFRGRAYIDSPGGAVLTVNNVIVGFDAVGIAGWLDWTTSTHSHILDLGHLLRTGKNVVVLSFGCGAWCVSTTPTWSHSHRTIVTAAGGQPVARIIVTAQDSTTGSDVAVARSGDRSSATRVGPVLTSSSWYGSVMDWTLNIDSGWVSPPRTVPNDTVAKDIPSQTATLALPPVKIGPPIRAASVTKVSATTFVYQFPTMVVGIAEVFENSWAGTGGNISIEFCEWLVHPENGTCWRQHGFESHGTVDTHIVGPRSAASPGPNGPLSPRFTWRGFLFAVVRISGGATFRGLLGDLVARWASVDIENTGATNMIDNDPTTAKIFDLTRRGLHSNLVTGMPTDCPTREKHGWLGDAMGAATGAMYIFFTPTLHSLFVDQISSSQASGSSDIDGFVPVVVPCHRGVDASQNDLGWTAGYIMITKWLVDFYGSVDVTRRHWPSLRRWINGQLYNATLSDTGGVPAFHSYGDLAAQGDNCSRTFVAEAAAAGNFMQAFLAAIELAVLLNETNDVVKWTMVLPKLQATFDINWAARLDQISCGGAVQTVAPLAMTALMSPRINNASISLPYSYLGRRRELGEMLLADVEERGQLTVGAEGARKLLSTLSSVNAAGHDAALRLVAAKTFPGWGYWADQGATTCWEGWPTMEKKGQDQ